MYQVIAVMQGKEHVLLDIRDERYMLEAPKLTLQINNAGAFVFNIHPTHPEFKCLVPLITIIKVYKTDCRTYKQWMFTGRVISCESNIHNSKKIRCEGVLAYLIDSVVYPYEYQGTPAEYVRQMISAHNSQVDIGKQFSLRTLDLSDIDTNNNIIRANKNYPTTMQEMKDKVLKLLGAYISVEDVDGKLYLDCSQNITHYNKQDIRLGENIISLTQTKTAGNIRTVMIGLGAEDKEGNRPSALVENSSAIKKYGRIVGTVEFENVSTQTQIEKKTKAYLDSILAETDTLDVNAVDLNMTDPEIEAIELGYCYVESKYHNLDHVRMIVSKIDLYLTDPGQNVFTLGVSARSMTTGISQANAEVDQKVKRIASSMSPKIQYAVENATQLITGAKGGYVVLDCGENADKHPEQILIMDAPEKENAKNVIRINKNGIGFSTTGYDGPYSNAWTIDGNFVADFITAGTMFADRIRGGTLLIGGETDGVITVVDKSNNTVAVIDKDGITIYKGSIRGSTIIVGGTNNADGSVTVLDEKGNVVAEINKDGVSVQKGSIRGSTITVGGTNNADGSITVMDGDGNIKITIDANGINVNNKFKVDMDGNMEAISISGDAVEQINDIIDNSEAMKTAKDAIKKASKAIDEAKEAADTAQKAADKAQETADIANSAATTANNAAAAAKSAADAAQTAANKAQAAIDALKVTVTNLNNMVSQINEWIKQLSTQIKELGKPGIS